MFSPVTQAKPCGVQMHFWCDGLASAPHAASVVPIEGTAKLSTTWKRGGASRQHRLDQIGRWTSFRQLEACSAPLGDNLRKLALLPGPVWITVVGGDCAPTSSEARRQADCLRQEWQLVKQHSGFSPLRFPGTADHATARAVTLTSVTAFTRQQNQDVFDRGLQSSVQQRQLILQSGIEETSP